MEFVEEQKFKSKFFWGILIVSCIASLAPLCYGFYQQIIMGVPYGNNPMGDIPFLIMMSFILLLFAGLFWLLASASLLTSINAQEIRFRYKPFQTKAKVISWEEIQSYELDTFKSVRQYGGWGVRMTNGGMAYVVSGNRGLKILLKNGKSILIGTQKEEELKKILQSLGK